MSHELRALALAEFGLPHSALLAAVGRLPAGGEALRGRAPGGDFLLLVQEQQPLQVAFEAALFDLLAEARFPCARPRRSRIGSFAAALGQPGGAAAACYGWPAGEAIEPALAGPEALLEIGRVLARLHQLGEAHPAAVADPCESSALAVRLERAAAADGRRGPVDRASAERIASALRVSVAGLPSGAAHGGLGPTSLLFLGERVSAVLPAGRAASLPLALDLAESLAAWALPLSEPLAAMGAIASGYRSLRPLAAEERAALPACVRLAAAREGARRWLAGAPDALAPLEAAGRLTSDAIEAIAR